MVAYENSLSTGADDGSGVLYRRNKSLSSGYLLITDISLQEGLLMKVHICNSVVDFSRLVLLLSKISSSSPKS